MFRTVALAASLALALAPQRARPVDLEAADCSHVNMMFGDDEVARAVQRASVPISAGTLEIQPESNGGVKVERGGGNSYAITACIGAGARTLAEAQAAADSVRLDVQGGRVRTSGGSGARNWSVQLIVSAPDRADIAVETHNGPISFEDVSGRFDARAVNGPIAVRNVRGEVHARAQNGPVHVEGSEGEFDIETQNGPVSIELSGRRWDGHLDARAHNGPLDVRVPSDYQSGVEISSSFHSPWSCRLAACRSGNRDWDDRSRSLHLGSDPTVVRISTNNGPVTVSDR
jgi:DUF4097 and DUF4098 domain-containing protein YvlB